MGSGGAAGLQNDAGEGARGDLAQEHPGGQASLGYDPPSPFIPSILCLLQMPGVDTKGTCLM